MKENDCERRERGKERNEKGREGLITWAGHGVKRKGTVGSHTTHYVLFRQAACF